MWFLYGYRWDTTFGLLGNASVTPMHRKETSQGACNCNLLMAQTHIQFQVFYSFGMDAFLQEAIFARPPLRSNAIYEDVYISYGVDWASKRSDTILYTPLIHKYEASLPKCLSARKSA